MGQPGQARTDGGPLRLGPPASPPGAPLPSYPASGPEREGPTAVTRSPRLLVAVLVVVLLIASVGVAAHGLTEPAGADSPEDAVTDLVAAINERDVLEVFGSFSPAERQALQPGLEEMVGELQRLDVLDEFSLADVPGLEIDVDADGIDTDEIDDGIVAVTFSGDVSAEAVGEDLPLGELVYDLADEYDADSPDGWEDDVDESFEDVTLVAVEEADRWYVSLGYSIAENARLDGGADEPDLDDAIEPEGAATPEDAVRDLVDAAIDGDVEDVIGMLPPDEMEPLYVYAPLFLDDSESDGGGSDVTIEELDLESEGHGATRRVTATSFLVTTDDGYAETSVGFDGECLVFEEEYDGEDAFEDPFSAGLFGPTEVCLSGESGTSGGLSGGLYPTMPVAIDSSVLALTVVSVDGRWYVSPTRTVLDTANALLAQIEPEQLSELTTEGGSWLFYSLFAASSFVDPYAYEDDYVYEDDYTYEENPELEDAYLECDLIYEEAFEAVDSGDYTDAEIDDLYEQLDAEYDACLDEADEQFGD